jgi:hypothetical protein
VLQYPVDGIVNGSRCGAHDAEPDEFAECLFFLHVASVFERKDTQKQGKSEEKKAFLLLFSQIYSIFAGK